MTPTPIPVEHEIWEILEFLLDLERGEEATSSPDQDVWERVLSYVAMQKGTPSRKFYSNFKKFPHDPATLSEAQSLLQEAMGAKRGGPSKRLSAVLFSLLSVTHPHHGHDPHDDTTLSFCDPAPFPS